MHVFIDQACQLLKSGHVVAVPTETVYGLAASLHHPKAIKHIFTLKNRPSNNPLIIHLANKEQIASFNPSFPPSFKQLADDFWPGPLTIVIPVDPNKVLEIVRAGLQTAAFRVPANPLTRQLLAISGPLVMPSANLSGTPSATLAHHVEHDFGQDFPVIDGGECTGGIESTIIMHQEGSWKILRLGALAGEDFVKVLGYEPEIVVATKGKAPLCPGQLYRHYAPEAKLIPATHFPLNTENAVVIGFSDRPYPQNYRLIALGASDAPDEAAHNLYAVLRQIDSESLDLVYIDIDFPKTGLWRTLKERILKAAQT
jgi:L-threonylcarbamoyladenylate synthase